jgi:hypothetical protein
VVAREGEGLDNDDDGLGDDWEGVLLITTLGVRDGSGLARFRLVAVSVLVFMVTSNSR